MMSKTLESSLSQQILSLVSNDESTSVLLPKGRTFVLKPYFQSVKGYVADKKQVTDICRTCYRGILNNYFVKLTDRSDKTVSEIRKMLLEVNPNIDLHIYANPVMCKTCVTLLLTCYEFKEKCTRTEEKLHKWVSQRNNVDNTDVNLLVLVQPCIDKDDSNVRPNETPKNIATEKIPDKSLPSPPKRKPKKKVKKLFIYGVDLNKTEIVKPKVVTSVLCQKCGQIEKADGKCSKCGNVFNNLMKTLDCKECGKEFNKLENLKSHKKTAHVASHKYLCSFCGKTFKLNCSYQMHRLTHETAKEKIVTCVKCKKRFENKQLYFEHIRFCHRKRKFKCNICDLHYWKWRNFNYHVRSKHVRRNERRCYVCKITFSCQSKYVRHLIKCRKSNNVQLGQSLRYSYENVTELRNKIDGNYIHETLVF